MWTALVWLIDWLGVRTRTVDRLVVSWLGIWCDVLLRSVHRCGLIQECHISTARVENRTTLTKRIVEVEHYTRTLALSPTIHIQRCCMLTW